MYLKFLNENSEIYNITGDIKRLNNKILFYQTNIPECTDGFELYLDDGTIESYAKYTVIYNKTNNYIGFTNDTRDHYIYYIYDNENFITSYLTSSQEIKQSNIIFIRKGKGAYYENASLEEFQDENGLPKLKVKFLENGIKEVIPITEEDYVYLVNRRLKKAKDSKIAQFSDICEKNIINGIDYNNKHFSYEVTDQNNLYNAVQLSLTTGLSVPYHADNETCELYSQEDIVSIYIAQQQNLTHNSTYYNQLKMLITDLVLVEEVEAVYYGQELTGEYLDKYNEIMAQAQAITTAFVSQQSL